MSRVLGDIILIIFSPLAPWVLPVLPVQQVLLVQRGRLARLVLLALWVLPVQPVPLAQPARLVLKVPLVLPALLAPPVPMA